MARNFVAASAQYLESGTVVRDRAPLTISGWVYPFSAASISTVLVIFANAYNNQYRLTLGNGSALNAFWLATDGGTSYINTANVGAANAWNHLLAIEQTSPGSSRSVRLNGGAAVGEPGNRAPSGFINTLIGANSANYSDARIAEVGVWNINLSTDEQTALSQGFSPLLIRPQSLVAYWPLYGQQAPEPSLLGGHQMLLRGGPTAADHPRIYRPTPARIGSAPPAGPPAPVYLAPANGAANLAPPQGLAWDASAGATSYDVYYGTSAAPPFIGNQTALTYTPPAQTPGATYYWQIGARNADGVTFGPIWSFTIQALPAAPTYSGPANGGANLPTPQQLAWTAASGAASYDVYFGTSSAPPFVANQTGLTYTPPAQAPGTLYYWRIVAKNAVGETPGAVWSFTTLAPPSAPTYLAPGDGATDQLSGLALTWSAAAGATAYDVYLGASPAPPLVASDVAGLSFTPPLANDGATWYWQIRAKNGSGATAGPIWSFSMAAPPAAPTYLAPADGATHQLAGLALTWAAAPGAASYDVRFGTAPAPPLVASAISALTYTPAIPANDGTVYYWQIVARNAVGTSAGPVWSFALEQPPASPHDPQPPSGAIDIAGGTPLQWTSEGATSYRVYFGTTDPPPLVESAWPLAAYAPPALDPSTRYYWQIAAINPAGEVLGPRWSFTSDLGTVPHTPTPPNGSQAGPLSLQWLGTGEAFDVYVGTSSPPPLAGSTSGHAWALPPLVAGTVYYWQIVATGEPPTPGAIWSFTAAAPSPLTYLAPSNQSENLAPPVLLAWAADAAVAGVVYDVAFGPVASRLPTLSSGQADTTFTTGALAEGVTYYWRITARNNVGVVEGPIWSFGTRLPTRALITIGGEDVRRRVRLAGLSVRDLLADTPNTATLTVEGAAPIVGQELRIGLGSLAGDDVIFGGYLDTVDAIYEGRPENRAWRVTAQDYVYGFNRRKVRTRYGASSATAIARDLLAAWAPSGYTGTQIAEGLPIVEGGIDFTDEDLTACFARLAQRIGGYWYVDYAKDVHLFISESSDAPAPITRAARVLLEDPPVHWTTDLTQIRTRVFVEGGGAEARALIAPGDLTLPVTDGGWYNPAGGLIVSGPQRIRYTGKQGIGGGPAPSAAALLVAGALGAGPYRYVTTTIKDGNESPLSAPSGEVLLPPAIGPAAPLGLTPVVGQVAAPASPVLSPVGTVVAAPATGPNCFPSDANSGQGAGSMAEGSYRYGVAYATANGETTVGPTTLVNTSGFVPPANKVLLEKIPISPDPRVIARKIYRTKVNTSAPLYFDLAINDNTTTADDYAHAIHSKNSDAQLGAASSSSNTSGGGKLTPGALYAWVVTFVTAAGETTAGPSASVTLTAAQDTVDLVVPTSGDARVTKRRIYRTAAGGGAFRLEATIPDNTTTAYRSATVADGALGSANPPATNTTGTGGLTPGEYQWTYRYVTATGETEAAPPASVVLAPGTDTVELTLALSPDGRVTKRRIYRTPVGGGTFRFEAEIANNTATSYSSTKADAALGADLIPGSSSAAGGQIAVSNIQIGPAGTTARRIYRTASGGADYRYVAQLDDNATTTYTDNKADASLGAGAPIAELIELVGIPASGDGAVRFEIRPGDEVNILVQCDDAAAQADLAALEGPPSLGIVEHVIQDRRLALSQATATGLADLALFARPILTIQYATRDPKTRSGKTVRIDLPELSLVGDFTIQTVDIDEIDLHPGLYPKYRVTCSSVRFSFEDAIRRFTLDPTPL